MDAGKETAAAPQQWQQRDTDRTVAGKVQEHSVQTRALTSGKRSHDVLVADYAKPVSLDEESHRVKRAAKVRTEYGPVSHMPTLQENLREKGGCSTLWGAHGHKEHSAKQGGAAEYKVIGTHPCPSGPGVPWTAYCTVWSMPSESAAQSSAGTPPASQEESANWTAAGVGDISRDAGISEHSQPPEMSVAQGEAAGYRNSAFMPKEAPTTAKPWWHPPWELHRVIRGHKDGVRCIAVEPGNQWFATGSDDRTIKIWDLDSGKLKLSLTGLMGAPRGLIVSARSPYLFSCGQLGQVKCWDVEYSKVIRHYRGHLSNVYGLDLHPTIDVLVTCGRDLTTRVWDPRTEACVHTLSGHTLSVGSVKCHATEETIITASYDTTIMLWDLVAAKTPVTLRNHRKAVRALVLHPIYNTFASGSLDGIKQWKFPNGTFIQNLSGHNAQINTLAVNSDDVLVSAAGDGSMHFWDWTTGQCFQSIRAPAHTGWWHEDCDSRIFACAFDQSGRTLLTVGADETIRVYGEYDTVTEEYRHVTKEPEIYMRNQF